MQRMAVRLQGTALRQGPGRARPKEGDTRRRPYARIYNVVSRDYI